MEQKTLTKIMWLEEDRFVIDRFQKEAQEFDLDLQPFTCWEDAKNELVSDIKGWGAIILDPKCKLGRGDRPKPQKFLPQVFCDITSLSAKYDVIIPWYVFTGLDSKLFEDLIIKDREQYDAGWERPYYSTEEDSENLFDRIRMQVSSIDRTKIRQGIHKDLFDKMSELTNYGLVNEDITTMEDILISLYDGKESKRCNFINLRKIIENLFRSMIQFKVIPDDLFNSIGEINITAGSRLLAGMDCKVGTYQYQLEETVIDSIAAYNLFNIINVCHGYAHSESIKDTSKRKKTNKYLETTQTNNLLHSCALMLADIIIMYHHSIEKIGPEFPKHIFWTKTKCEQNMQRYAR